MTATRLDVVGIGNAIVDIIGRCDDAFLAKFGATKGAMKLVEPPELMALYSAMGPGVETSGGSAANTIAGVASFGGNGGFIGKVGDDEFGRIFRHDITALGVAFSGSPVAGGATSRSLILVTPDGERTMNTYLGISTSFGEDDLDADLLASAAIVYLEGYLFDRPEGKAAFRKAVAIAREAGCRVALTLSDGFCVDRHRAEFLEFMRSGVDLVFANESELASLYQAKDFVSGAALIGLDVPLAVVTRSEQGCVIVENGVLQAVPASPVATVVDTTGAGDLFAAGFLFGVARGLPRETSARLGAMAAAEVISHVGARPQANLAELARKHALLTA